ncbi:hypothetical protein ACFSR6_02960 [Pedobacter vanadiisoli]|uniref:Uncharacterized protein n=1 Tax=Pedobacter vanadiisoli TaxID=1761975 RepID=A0ABW5MG57_9SPHI
MKKIFTLLSALFIVTGLKAQKVAVQKETVKPKVDTIAKNVTDKKISATTDTKDAKIAQAIKYAPTSKVTPVAAKAGKLAPVKAN